MGGKIFFFFFELHAHMNQWALWWADLGLFGDLKRIRKTNRYSSMDKNQHNDMDTNKDEDQEKDSNLKKDK